MSAEVYKKNKQKVKICKIMAPIVFWGFLALSVVFLILALKNSFGNIGEIINLLDNKKFTGEELSANYSYLIEKYGEWNIGNGGSGFEITFVNIGSALFSGVAMFSIFCALFFFVGAFIIGKWLLPAFAKHIEQSNQDMVNMKILEKEE